MSDTYAKQKANGWLERDSNQAELALNEIARVEQVNTTESNNPASTWQDGYTYGRQIERDNAVLPDEVREFIKDAVFAAQDGARALQLDVIKRGNELLERYPVRLDLQASVHTAQDNPGVWQILNIKGHAVKSFSEVNGETKRDAEMWLALHVADRKNVSEGQETQKKTYLQGIEDCAQAEFNAGFYDDAHIDAEIAHDLYWFDRAADGPVR